MKEQYKPLTFTYKKWTVTIRKTSAGYFRFMGQIGSKLNMRLIGQDYIYKYYKGNKLHNYLIDFGKVLDVAPREVMS